MSPLPWFKCYPQDLLDGMAGMPADERGIYISVLCLIYRNGGPIRDDAREMAYHTGCTAARWGKYRAALIVHGKLKVVQINGRDFLSNERCEAELEARKSFVEERVKRGKNGSKIRHANCPKNRHQISEGKSNENTGRPLAAARHVLSRSLADIDIDIDTVPISNEIATGDEVSPNARAWATATTLLVGQGSMTPDSARAFFGKLLSTHGLEPSEMLSAIGEAEHTRTRDPQAMLTRWAQTRSRKAPKVQKRVGFV